MMSSAFIPPSRYVMIDDKLRILPALKDTWGDRVTTVFPRQGHYAFDAAEIRKYRAADISIDAIGDLLDLGATGSATNPSKPSRICMCE